MNRLLCTAALIAVALPSVVFAEEIVLPPTQEEIDKFNECLRGKASIDCVLPTRTIIVVEPAMEEHERPFFRYACMDEGWLCPRHVGVWHRDEDRADDSNRSESAEGARDRSNARADAPSSAPSGNVGSARSDRDSDRGRDRGRDNPCKG